MRNILYSIGHGSRSVEIFTTLLKTYGIRYLIDVRSLPYSKFHARFRRHELEYFLRQNNITYVYMGNLLGGRPTDVTCYANGKINYDLVKTKDFFLEGIERLKKAYAADVSAAIMCSESKPGQCHRNHLIGKFLEQQDIFLTHIDEKGNCVTGDDDLTGKL